MTKKIDWDANYTGAIKRKTGAGQYASYREMLAKNRERAAEAQKAQEQFRIMEPLLRKSLFDHMVNRLPILVTRPLRYFTEELTKGGASTEGSFISTTKTVAPGTQMTYVGLNKTLGTWLFKCSDGTDVEIYNTPVIALGVHDQAQNPGYWGLMTQTKLYDDLLRAMTAAEEENE